MNFHSTKNLEKKSLWKCEVCKGFHPTEEMELITVKIIKGKKCELTAPPIIAATPFPVGFKMPNDIGSEIMPPVKRPPVIPPGIVGTMIPPGHPDFETKGAKEQRTV